MERHDFRNLFQRLGETADLRDCSILAPAEALAQNILPLRRAVGLNSLPFLPPVFKHRLIDRLGSSVRPLNVTGLAWKSHLHVFLHPAVLLWPMGLRPREHLLAAQMALFLGRVLLDDFHEARCLPSRLVEHPTALIENGRELIVVLL